MGSWNLTRLAGKSGFYAELCRDVSGDAVSPYNAAFQGLLGSHAIQVYTSAYGFPWNVARGTTPLAGISAGVAKYPASITGVPFTPYQFCESWPPVYTATVTNNSSTVTGSGFQATANPGNGPWPIVVGGAYVINGALPYVYVQSIQSDTQLTLSAPAPANGTTLTGPFNLACQFNTAGADHHQIVFVRNEATGLPSKLYEMYGALSTDGGATWGETVGSPGVGCWDLETGAQLPDFDGASSAAGLPYGLLCPNYDEILQGAILHAWPMAVGGGAGVDSPWGLGAGGCVFPAPTTNGNPGAAYKSGGLPLGARIRLKASFDISGFSAVNQIILTSWKRYGIINVDWTSPNWLITPEALFDGRWSETDRIALSGILSTNFELIDTVKPRFAFSGPSQVTHGVSSSWTLTQEPHAAAMDSNYLCNLYLSWSNDGGTTWSGTGISTSPGGSCTPSNKGPFTVTFTPPSAGSYLLRLLYGGPPWLAPDNFPFMAS
jgi:hypothetical protein